MKRILVAVLAALLVPTAARAQVQPVFSPPSTSPVCTTVTTTPNPNTGFIPLTCTNGGLNVNITGGATSGLTAPTGTTVPLGTPNATVITGSGPNGAVGIAGTLVQQPTIFEATSSAITVTASSAYTAGNEVGQLLTFTLPTGYQTGILQSIQIDVKSAQSNAYVLYLFSAQPTASTWADKTTPNIQPGDKFLKIGPWNVAAYDNHLGTDTAYSLGGIATPFSSATQVLYGVLVTTAAVTYSSTSDVQVSLGILPG